MSTNSLVTPEIITKESLRLLSNMVVMAGTVSRAHEDDFQKIGEDLYVRKPNRFTSAEGATTTAQDVEEAWQKVTVRTQRNISWQFSTRDLTLTVERYSERYIKPAVEEMVSQIEQSLHNLYKKVYHTSVPAGGVGTFPASFKDLGAQGVLLTDHAVPMTERTTLLSSDACLNLADQVAGFASAYGVERKAVKAQEEAKIGKFANFATHESALIVRHTYGAQGGTPLIDGAAQNTTYALAKNNTNAALSWTQSLAIKGGSNSITDWVLEGDVFTIAGVYSVNPETRLSTGKLQQFVVRADASTDGTGDIAAMTISPPIITSGPHQTVDSAPADGAAIVFPVAGGGIASQNLSYHKEAISFGMVPMEMPDSVTWGNTETADGFSIRVYKWMDGTNDKEYIRMDAMWFTEVVQHDMIARLQAG